jgi:hypothetical protein
VHTVFRLAFVPVLVLTLGLHWALLQSVAWTGMFISYSQENSFRTAVRMTFDGKNPCCMCKSIKQGRSEERKETGQKLVPGLKLEFPLPPESVALLPREFTELPPSARKTFATSFLSEPLTPPPRPGAAV